MMVIVYLKLQLEFGKTFSAIDIIQDILYKDPDTRILIVVPKNVILETGWYKELVDFGIPIQKLEYIMEILKNMRK